MDRWNTKPYPWLIQGGMGIGVSGWKLASAVATTGQLGVVSGTALDTVFIRRLQDEGVSPVVQECLDAFPNQEIVGNILARYAHPRHSHSSPYRLLPMYSHHSPAARDDVTVLAAFVEVSLAKRGHTGVIGINLLTKVQFPTVPTLFGAMLAGVDVVLMGAGIPRAIPGVLDKLSALEPVNLKIDGAGKLPEGFERSFLPDRYTVSSPLDRPAFLPIVSSVALATMMVRKASGAVEGFVIEGPTAGGHNAPPRGAPVYDDRGQPVYGERDVVDLKAFCDLGYPFWLAGGMNSPERVSRAIEQGATGVQVGTLFALSRESGMSATLRKQMYTRVVAKTAVITTDPRASSTGFPFKVVELEGTVSQQSTYEKRERICDLGYLREAYVSDKGSIKYRCSAEPIQAHLLHGGTLEATLGRKCLCNALFATIGLGQKRLHEDEPPIVTSGDDLAAILPLVRAHHGEFTAADVVQYLQPRSVNEATLGEATLAKTH